MSSISNGSEVWHPPLKIPGVDMNTGQMIFTQVMDVMPLKTFHRYLPRRNRCLAHRHARAPVAGFAGKGGLAYRG
jgi:hypothetical protein